MKTIRSQLLNKLIAGRGDFVSGGMLSEALNVSRVSIKNYADQLIEEGFEIEAVRNRGYRIVREPNHFHDLCYISHLNNVIPESQIFCFDEIDSTNAEVERQLNAEQHAPVIGVASAQHRGKGRRGNQWVSSSGKNLYLSVGFRPEIEASRIGQYTLWIGLCLAEFLSQKTDLNVQVKWPNDLYISGKKVAGILSEAKIDTDHVQHLIVGVGLNINLGLSEYPEDLKAKATSLCDEVGDPLNFNAVAAEITKVILDSSKTYFASLVKDQIQKKWVEYDFLKDRRVIAKGIKTSVEGIACGIDDDGQLLIILENGEQYPVNSGEVTMAF